MITLLLSLAAATQAQAGAAKPWPASVRATAGVTIVAAEIVDPWADQPRTGRRSDRQRRQRDGAPLVEFH